MRSVGRNPQAAKHGTQQKGPFCVLAFGRAVVNESWSWMASPRETPAVAYPTMRAAPDYAAGTGSRHGNER